MKNKSSHPTLDARLRTPTHCCNGWLLLELLYLLACIIKLRLQLLCLRLKTISLRFRIFKARLQSGYFRLRGIHLAFKERDMISERGSRTMLANPFFNISEWIHIFRGVKWPNVES